VAGRPDEDAVFAFFRDNERSLFDAQPPAGLCGQHHGAAATDLAGQCFHTPEEPKVRSSGDSILLSEAIDTHKPRPGSE
jgi:hypothetical protein